MRTATPSSTRRMRRWGGCGGGDGARRGAVAMGSSGRGADARAVARSRRRDSEDAARSAHWTRAILAHLAGRQRGDRPLGRAGDAFQWQCGSAGSIPYGETRTYAEGRPPRIGRRRGGRRWREPCATNPVATPSPSSRRSRRGEARAVIEGAAGGKKRAASEVRVAAGPFRSRRVRPSGHDPLIRRLVDARAAVG